MANITEIEKFNTTIGFSILQRINIKNSAKIDYDDDISFKDNFFKEDIYISNITFNNKVNFDSISFEKDIEFSNCIFKKDFEFKDIYIGDNITFTNCSFEKLSFINIDLKKSIFNGVKIKKLYLENATLNDCIFNGVEFLNDYKLEKEKLSNKQLKDNYRQLKYVMDSNGNYTEANKFFSREMETYMKSLEIKKTGFIKTIKELYNLKFTGKKTKKIGEKIVLNFSYSINEFGNNWIKPLFFILVLALTSTIFDGVSTIFGENNFINENSKINNYLGDLFFITLLFFSLFLIYKIDGTKIENKIVSFYENKIVSLIILFIIILFLFLIPNFDSLKVFGNLLNPLYFYEKGLYYNGIETLGLVLYKTLYGILLWHLVVALKRTTKR